MHYATGSTTYFIVPIGIGDFEAMISAFGFATGVLFLSKLLSRYSSIEATGSTMLMSGSFLFTMLLIGILAYGTNSVLLTASAAWLVRNAYFDHECYRHTPPIFVNPVCWFIVLFHWFESNWCFTNGNDWVF